jgi:transcription-repair coupling factor (superfamily II helicase)
LEVTQLRQLANRLGLKDVNLLTGIARIQPVDLAESEQVKLSRSYQGLKYLQSAKMLQIPIPKSLDGQTVSGEELIDFTKEIFEILRKMQEEQNQ